MFFDINIACPETSRIRDPFSFLEKIPMVPEEQPSIVCWYKQSLCENLFWVLDETLWASSESMSEGWLRFGRRVKGMRLLCRKLNIDKIAL